MAQYTTFRELVVWQEGMSLAESVYRTTATLRPIDLWSLGNQLRRAAISIPANVAEGFGRHSRAAYRSHVAIALGSQAELITHIELASRLALIQSDRVTDLRERTTRVGRLLNGLWRALG